MVGGGGGRRGVEGEGGRPSMNISSLRSDPSSGAV